MAFALLDSFDGYTTLSGPWIVLAGSPAIASTTPRSGPNFLNAGSGGNAVRILPSAYGELIVGCGIYLTSLASVQLVALKELGVADHVFLGTDGANRLELRRGSTVLGTGTNSLTINTWHWVEFRAKISDTVGTLEARLNGAVEIGPLTNQDTRNGGTSGLIDAIGLLSGRFDDLFVVDPTVGTPSNFLGDTRLECLFPDGNGATSGMTGSDGNSVDNYLLVDDPTQHDGNTTYVESSVLGTKDTYTFQDLSPTIAIVHGVGITTVAGKVTAGSRKLKDIARLAAAFPTTSLLDNFNRADENPIVTNWTSPAYSDESSTQLFSNQVVFSAAGSAYYDVASYDPACEAWVTITTQGPTGYFELRARMQDVGGVFAGADFYSVRYTDSTTTFEIAKVVAGSRTVLATTALHDLADGDGIGISCNGSTITAYKRVSGVWSSVTSATDTAIAAGGRIGFASDETAMSVDDFGGGTIVATEEDSSAEYTLTNGYVYYQSIRSTKPGGGSWSQADVDAAEFGVKIST